MSRPNSGQYRVPKVGSIATPATSGRVTQRLEHAVPFLALVADVADEAVLEGDAKSIIADHLDRGEVDKRPPRQRGRLRLPVGRIAGSASSSARRRVGSIPERDGCRPWRSSAYRRHVCCRGSEGDAVRRIAARRRSVAARRSRRDTSRSRRRTRVPRTTKTPQCGAFLKRARRDSNSRPSVP